MGFRHWSTSASGNANPGGLGTINYAEGQAPSTLNNSARQMMADIRTEYDANNWGWVKESATASIASQTTFKIPNDRTAYYTVGRRLRHSGGSVTRYSTVLSSSYTAETVVTIVRDGGSLSASMSLVAISSAQSPGIHLSEYIIAASDETTALTTGTAKVTCRIRGPFTVVAVRAALTTAQSSGSIFTVDVNESGSTILSTKLTIDNGEKTSTTALTPAVLSDTSIADDAEITIDIDQIGDGTAKGLKVSLIGYPT